MMKIILAGLFFFAGLAHFLWADNFIKIVPPFVPQPELAVQISGAAAVILSILLLPRKTQTLSAWGIIFYLAAVFPANIYMALRPQIFPQIPLWLLYARLPLQGILVFWAHRYTRVRP